jgi:hypothetical protein
VRPAAGGDAVSASATTSEEGVAVDAEPAPIELDPGTYTVSERLPRVRGGRWQHTGVNCNAQRGGAAGPVEVTVTAGRGQVCTFENRFVSAGGIAVSKVTNGGVGTSGFVITSLARPHRQYVQRATTTADGEPLLARGDSTRRQAATMAC